MEIAEVSLDHGDTEIAELLALFQTSQPSGRWPLTRVPMLTHVCRAVIKALFGMPTTTLNQLVVAIQRHTHLQGAYFPWLNGTLEVGTARRRVTNAAKG